MKRAIDSKIFLFFLIFLLSGLSIISAVTFSSKDVISGVSDYCTVDANDSCVIHSDNLTKTNFNMLNSIDKTKITIIFFYSSKCDLCKDTIPYIESVEQKYGDKINIQKYDVAFPKNQAVFDSFCTKTDIQEKRIPMVAIGKNIYTGTDSIKENLEKDIDGFIASGERIHPLQASNCTATQTETNNSDSVLKVLGIKSLKFLSILPVILLAGLGDGINPCAFSILILLMTVLQQLSDNKKRLKKIIGTYIFSLFLVNVLLGIIYFYTTVQLSSKLGAGSIFRYLIAGIAIVAGFINLKDYFFYGQGISLHIPDSSQKFIHGMVNRASVVSAAILGSAIALLEAPCSIPIYLTVLEILRNQGWGIIQAMPFILLYNLMFILPLVVLALVIYYGKEAKALEKWRVKNRNIMRLIMGLIMLILATGLLLGWF